MFVSRPNEAPREVELVSGRPHVTKGNTVWLLRFKEITDRDDAETLRNYKCAPSLIFNPVLKFPLEFTALFFIALLLFNMSARVELASCTEVLHDSSWGL